MLMSAQKVKGVTDNLPATKPGQAKLLIGYEIMDFQCCHNFFGNLQITRLCYPNFLAIKNPNKIQRTIS